MPARFRFKLEKVLEYRSHLEEQARMALAKALSDYRRQADLIQALQNSLSEHEQNYNRLAGESSIEALWLWRAYKERLEFDIVNAQNDLRYLAGVLARCREKAVSAARERKLLETLKNKQAIDYATEERRREQIVFDETSVLRFKPEAH